MGTKNCPETPRQKMINMMYLVLTAMLALNVAAETLYAFKIVDSSLMKTYMSFTDKNQSLMANFNSAYELNQGKVRSWRNMAQDVHAKSDSLINYIIDTKEMLALAVNASPKEADEEIDEDFPYIVTNNNDTLIIERQDDLNASPEVMLTRKQGKNLQNQINSYKADLIEIVGDYPALVKNIHSSLDVNDPVKGDLEQRETYRTWAQQYFEATPVIAAITLLSKIQIDVRNAESAVLRHLYNQIDASSFKFTGLKATVIPEASYIFQGQEYKARIFLSAEDSTQELEVFMDGQNQPLPIENGDAVFSMKPNEAGEYSYNGEIRYRNPDGEGFGTKPFSLDFKVARPAVTVSPTKMNVLYRDLQNPVSISVPGVPLSNITPICTNGTIYKDESLSEGNWIVEPEELDYDGTNTRIIVNAELNGEMKEMGEMVFRVKRVPDPVAQVASMTSGNIGQERLALQNGVIADLEDFDFDLSFEVTSFDMSVPTSGGYTTTLQSNSWTFTAEQRRLLNSLGTGDRVSFENIKARIEGDENDQERQLSPVILTIQ
ncbi:MAG: gliding motility protein GldM [Prolixibacteraceae bacterium]|jgi:gliding motility-associated protein GldM|nr:gliding motility protein GldM [Prolixibacteraceae bacterium]